MKSLPQRGTDRSFTPTLDDIFHKLMYVVFCFKGMNKTRKEYFHKLTDVIFCFKAMSTTRIENIDLVHIISS